MITVNGYKLQPTIFPDGTSQVWKLPDYLLRSKHFNIDWRWEAKEAELFHLYQLVWLIRHSSKNDPYVHLYMPYMPFARQDKVGPANNDCTHAIYPFQEFITALCFDSIEVFDVHNPKAINILDSRFQNIAPIAFHNDVLVKVDPDILVFPDRGAYDRYPHLHDFKSYVIFDKVRDQATGRITGHKIFPGDKVIIDKADHKKVLIIDDLCDGGATFLSVASAIEKINYTIRADERFLAVSHGIFSAGTGKLNAAFNSIYTTNSLCKTDFILTNKFEV